MMRAGVFIWRDIKSRPADVYPLPSEGEDLCAIHAQRGEGETIMHRINAVTVFVTPGSSAHPQSLNSQLAWAPSQLLLIERKPSMHRKAEAPKHHQALRESSTLAERKLWSYIRNRKLSNAKFRRQAPIGPFIVDFFSPEYKLIVELDGGHHQTRVDSDDLRTAWLVYRGYRVIRIWNDQVLRDIEAVLTLISEAIENRRPQIGFSDGFQRC